MLKALQPFSVICLAAGALFAQTTNNLRQGQSEQVWDREMSPEPELPLAVGTGSAAPLASSMAQLIRLAVNLRVGRNLDTPAVVAARYLRRW